jgi:hypothetical protein
LSDNVTSQTAFPATIPNGTVLAARSVAYSGDTALVAPVGLGKFSGADDAKTFTDISPATEVTLVAPADAQTTRPVDAIPYSIGDLIANSVTAGSVTPLSFTGATKTGAGGSGKITGWVGRKSGSAAATIRFHFLKTAHAVTNGDNAALLFTTLDIDNYLGAMDVTFTALDIFGSGGSSVARSLDPPIPYVLATGDTIYVFLQAIDAFTPVSGGTLGGRPIFEVWS